MRQATAAGWFIGRPVLVKLLATQERIDEILAKVRESHGPTVAAYADPEGWRAWDQDARGFAIMAGLDLHVEDGRPVVVMSDAVFLRALRAVMAAKVTPALFKLAGDGPQEFSESA